MKPFVGIAVITLAVGGCRSDYSLIGGVDVNPGAVTECDFTPVSGTKISQYDCNPVYPQNEDTNVGAVGFHVTEVLDHAYLNEIEGLELPTLERICVWIADFVAADLPGLTRVSVSRPSLSETCTLRLNP